MAISDFFSGGQTPDYLAGLLDDEQLRRLKANAQQNALMQFGLSALSQGGYSQTPVGAGEIFGKAGLAGMQGYQQGMQGGIEGIGTRAKLEELQRAKKQREAEDLFRSSVGQPNATRNIMTQPVPAPQYANAPNFQTQQQAPVATQEQYFDRDKLLREGLKSGVVTPKDYFDLTAKENKPRETAFAPNGQLVYKDTGENVTEKSFSAAKDPDKMTEEASRVAWQLHKKPLNQLTPEEMGSVNKYIEQARVRVAGAGVPSQAPGFKDATSLRQEYNTLPAVKVFGEVRNAFDQIKVGLSAESPAGDLAAATKFMKLLDPTSVVRETELWLAVRATGLYDRASSYFDRLVKGEKLNKTQRLDFLNVSTKMFNAAKNVKQGIDKQYEFISKKGGLDPILVIGNASNRTEADILNEYGVK